MNKLEQPIIAQEIKYQILEENGKSRVIFEDKTYLINTLRAKRFAILKTKKLIRLTKRMEQLMLVKKEENFDNPLLSMEGLTQKQINKKYKYESRHNHATNRKRDDKGRFLSRQQRKLQQQIADELLKGTITSPILVPEDPQEQHICYLLSTNGFINQIELMQAKFYQNNDNENPPETPWFEKRGPATPAVVIRKESMNPLQLMTPLMHFSEENQNMNFIGMFPMLGETNAKIEQEQDDNNQQQQQQQQMGSQLLLIDFLQQKTKKEESDGSSDDNNGNYFDYLDVGKRKHEPEVMHAN